CVFTPCSPSSMPPPCVRALLPPDPRLPRSLSSMQPPRSSSQLPLWRSRPSSPSPPLEFVFCVLFFDLVRDLIFFVDGSMNLNLFDYRKELYLVICILFLCLGLWRRR